jgi:hypothetical protein
VIAQILDYAKEFSRWNYDDLQRAVSAKTGRKGNALFEIVKESHPGLEESAFVDAVSQSLERGRFLLMILGDGIREGAASIANFIERVGTLEFTFGLVELSLFGAEDGSVFVQPRVLARTEIINRSIVILREGRLELAKETIADAQENLETEENDIQKWNRTFFGEFVAGLKLDDPDQMLPKPTGFPNVGFPLPPDGSQVGIVAVVKSSTIAEVYFRMHAGNLAERLSSELRLEQAGIEEELAIPVSFAPDKHDNFSASSRQLFSDVRDPANRDAIKAFLSDAVNRYVNVFKPRLERMAGTQKS